MPQHCAQNRTSGSGHRWRARRGADVSAAKRTAGWKSSRSRSPLTVGSSSTTSGARSRTPRCSPTSGCSPPTNASKLCGACRISGPRSRRGSFAFVLEREDIHMHIEAAPDRAPRRRGPQAAHGPQPQRPGRDRRQALDPRRHRPDRRAAASTCSGPSSAAAERHRDVILPGYTHLQRAQPVLAAHYFLAYVEKFAARPRPAGRLPQAGERPAAGGGRAGRHDAADRPRARRARRSASTGWPPTASTCRATATSPLELVFVLSLIAEHLSGWAEEWVLWCTTEFGFLELPDAFCTGSSIMPQKKNPDVLELIRGQVGPRHRRPATPCSCW